jgi:integrase/recombinase XerD
LKGLWIHKRSGKRYYRTSRGGKERYVPLPDDLPLDHPDFIAAWAAAAKGHEPRPAFASGTLGSTWRAVLASDRLAALSAVYRAAIAREAGKIVEKAGGVRAAAVQERHVRADLRGSNNQRARLKAWRFWAAVCLQQGWIATDPTTGIRAERPKTVGFPTWSRAEIEAFRAAFPIGTTARAIMELAYWTGARIGDVVQIGPQHVGKDGVLAYRQGKTGDMAYVPWTCPLPAYGAHMAADRDLCRAALAHVGPGLTFLQTAHGRPRSHKAAGHVLAEACRKIGLDRAAHGLRKARAAALAEAGATPSQIGAWTGHRSLAEIAHYTAEMDRRGAVRGVEHEQDTGPVPVPIRDHSAK